MKTRKQWLIILCVIMALLLLVGCASKDKPSNGGDPTESAKAPEVTEGEETPEPSKKTIGISLLYRRDEYYKDLETTFVKLAKEMGFELNIQDADLDTALQIQQIEDFVTLGVDAIALAPCDAFGVIPAIQDALAANIPVFVFDSEVESNDPTCQIVFDLYDDGAIMGHWIVDYIKENLDGQADIAILDFAAEIKGSVVRARGFRETVEGAGLPGVKIVAHQDGEASRTISMEVMEDILVANPDVDIVFGINFDTCAGAKAACTAAGRDDVVIVGLGWGVETFEALENEDPMYKAFFIPAPPVLAENTMNIIRDYFDGKELPDTFEGKSFILDASNIGDYDWRSIIAMRTD